MTVCFGQLNAYVSWIGCDVLKHKHRAEFRLQISFLICLVTILTLLPLLPAADASTWPLLPLPRMNHFRYVYYRKQGYRRISPRTICFVSSFIKNSVHFCQRYWIIYLWPSLALSAISVLASSFLICWKSYCLHCNYVLELRRRENMGVRVRTICEHLLKLILRRQQSYEMCLRYRCSSTGPHYLVHCMFFLLMLLSLFTLSEMFPKTTA